MSKWCMALLHFHQEGHAHTVAFEPPFRVWERMNLHSGLGKGWTTIQSSETDESPFMAQEGMNRHSGLGKGWTSFRLGKGWTSFRLGKGWTSIHGSRRDEPPFMAHEGWTSIHGSRRDEPPFRAHKGWTSIQGSQRDEPPFRAHEGWTSIWGSWRMNFHLRLRKDEPPFRAEEGIHLHSGLRKRYTSIQGKGWTTTQGWTFIPGLGRDEPPFRAQEGMNLHSGLRKGWTSIQGSGRDESPFRAQEGMNLHSGLRKGWTSIQGSGRMNLHSGLRKGYTSSQGSGKDEPPFRAQERMNLHLGLRKGFDFTLGVVVSLVCYNHHDITIMVDWIFKKKIDDLSVWNKLKIFFSCFVCRLWWPGSPIWTQQLTNFWTSTSCCLRAATIWLLISLTWQRVAKVKDQSRAQWDSFCPWRGAWSPPGRLCLWTLLNIVLLQLLVYLLPYFLLLF